MGFELKDKRVAAIVLYPGAVSTEFILDAAGGKGFSGGQPPSSCAGRWRRWPRPGPRSADLGQHAAKGIALRKRPAPGEIRTRARIVQPGQSHPRLLCRATHQIGH